MIRHRIVQALLSAAAFAPSFAWAEQSQPASHDPVLDQLNGDWEIVHLEKKQTVQGCEKAQHFEVNNDQSKIILTEPWANFRAEYRVIRTEEKRILTIIEGESRLNAQNDPVLWWFEFSDAGTFWFRRYDWPATERTSVIWRRCPAAIAQERP